MAEKKGLQGLEDGIKKIRAEVERFVRDKDFDKFLKKQDLEKFVRKEFIQSMVKTSKDLRTNILKDIKKEIESTRKILKTDFDKFAKEIRSEIKGVKTPAPAPKPKAAPKKPAAKKSAPKKASSKKKATAKKKTVK